MAEELKQTRIPRIESGSASTITRIPKPGSFARPNPPTLNSISKLVRPQLNGIASTKTNVQPLNSVDPTTFDERTFQTSALPRKSILYRFGAANKVQIKKVPQLLGKTPLKPTQFIGCAEPTPNDGRCIANETIELTKDTAMNVTKPVIDAKRTDATMDRSLTRSNTFVCDTVDDTQVKLLSITHNINMPQPNDTMNQQQQLQQQQQQEQQLCKERTFKRSLSPHPGETMNSAKRKLMQVMANQKIICSTPRRSITHSDSRKANLTFFATKNDEHTNISHIDEMQMQTFDVTTLEQSNSFVPDAGVQLGKASGSTMQGNRVLNVTQTVVEQQNDAFYPENRSTTQTPPTSDANAAEHELINGDTFIPTATSYTNINDGDGNLTKTITVEKTQPIQIVGSGSMGEDLLAAKKRFSLGLELPECTLDCSIELCDSSAATSAQDSSPLVNYKSQSYEMDESLGILTPDQMIEFLDTNATNAKIELPTSLPVKMDTNKCRIDQTPSPEELPLDPIAVKTVDTSKIEDVDITLQPTSMCEPDGCRSQLDSESKADQMTKSTTSKVTNSFITSVTSIASLDNGYHADGEMSRPASRGAESPMRRVHNARQNKGHANGGNVAVIRRPDPMTDSDFFTESDADDIFQRRHVHIIDGHMYNGQGADIFIDENPRENEMESSGVYTDVDHRPDDDGSGERQISSRTRNENESDMSPDSSTDTIKSSEYANDSKNAMPKTEFDSTKTGQKAWAAQPTHSTQSIAAMSNSSSTTINDSVATCLCEKRNSIVNGSSGNNSSSDGGGNGGGSSSRNSSNGGSGGGGVLTQLVINDASSTSVVGSSEKHSAYKLHSIGRNTDSDNSSKNAAKAVTPQFKSNGTPKVKRFSPNRKQCKSESVSTPSSSASSSSAKRNEINKRETKSNGGVNRNRASAIGPNKKSPGTKQSPNENGRHSETSINMTSDQTVIATVNIRKSVPNKWDVVMNKIALNKAEVKTVRYSEVKSKVTCGLKRNSPNLKALPSEASTASDSGNSSLISTKSTSASPVTRQSSHGNAKRSIERESSKDSRDLAVLTPGKQLKTSTPNSRSSARKRSSVQNGFSPNDSIKFEAIAKCESPTTKSAALHKRFTANNNSINQSVSGSPSPVSEKRSNIIASKKSSFGSKKHANSTTVNTVAAAAMVTANKTSHAKEHGLQSTLAHPPTINNNNNSSSINNNNNHGTKSGTNSTKLTSAAANDDHQQLIATIHRNDKASATATASTATNKIVATPKVKSKAIAKPRLNDNLIEFSINDSIDGNTSSCDELNATTIDAATAATTLIGDQIQRNLNQTQLPKPTPSDLNVIRANKTIVALSILIQHLTTDLKAFETPSLRAALGTAKDKLLESQHNFETMRTKCNSLEQEMLAKQHFFTTHELALKQANECELEKIKLNLLETEKSAQEQIQTLRYELGEIEMRHAETLKACQMKGERRCSDLETELQMSRAREHELMERLNNFTVTENQLRDKVQASEQEFAQRLITATARERELNEKVAHLMRQLKAGDDKRVELEEKLKLACNETTTVRKRPNPDDVECLPNGNASAQNLIGPNSTMLEEEVLSLRCVLEMKLNEISELRKQNHAMQSAQDELPKAQIKISVLESRLEDLTIQLKTKVEEEQELSMRNRSLQEMFNQEVKNRSRLALHNEELQWKLKQNSEKYTSTLSELSKSYQDPSLLADFKNSLYAPISDTNSETMQLNASPPSSPVVKGVVEKCDSVSYVLELNDDEPAETVASRVVKRAGSFRATNFKERSPSFKRQLSLGGANALSQSASATSLLRQHSDSPTKYISGGAAKIQKSSRTRSNSLNESHEPKKTLCSHVDMMPGDYSKFHNSAKAIATSSPMTTSRPHRRQKNGTSNHGLLEIDDVDVDTRSSSVSTDDVDIELAKEFMPCDSRSARNDFGATILPSQQQQQPQSAVSTLKKRQHIKESAGEAMVSQQSEDDQSFGSDMDSVSTSSSSAAVSPLHSDAAKGHRQLSLDETVFMNKFVASLSTRSTPMEVSWSEDGENEPPYAQESSA